MQILKISKIILLLKTCEQNSRKRGAGDHRIATKGAIITLFFGQRQVISLRWRSDDLGLRPPAKQLIFLRNVSRQTDKLTGLQTHITSFVFWSRYQATIQ